MNKGQSIFIIFIISFLILNGLSILFLTKHTVASGKEIYVDDDFSIIRDGSVEHPYQKISEAISVAENGDSIYVFGGTYNETLTINKRLSIIGGIDEGPSIISRNGDQQYTVQITEDFVTLENFIIDDKERHIWSQYGALIHVTSNNVVVQKNDISSCNLWGIYLDSSDDNTITGNVINDTKGVFISSSNNNIFSNNSISNSSDAGINLRLSSKNILYQNHIETSNFGIYSKDCSNTNVSENIITKTLFHGLYLTGDYNNVIHANILNDNTATGLTLNSDDCIIRNNLFNGGQIGISLQKTGCLIYNNSFENMSSIGLSAISFSNNNIISLNHFLSNGLNAREQGSNQWDDGEKGNYWDDYNYVDRNHDGVGDKIYTISTGGLDRYPLGLFLQPPNKPSDPSPADDRENVGLKVTLWVQVVDVDSNLLTEVSFYNAVDNSYLGSARNVPSGTNASYSLNLPFDTIFAWYAIANDSLQENQSDIWFFTTKQRPQQNEEPVADPGGPYETTLNQSIFFNGNKSFDRDGDIIFYRWNFGDGSSEILDMTPEHTYTDAGTYIVELTVVDDDGRSSMATTTVTIHGVGDLNNPPIAMFTAPSKVVVDQEVNFDASSSIDNNGAIIGYRWDFDGDGTFDTVWLNNPRVIYSFSSSGSFSVTLEVKNNANVIDSYAASILVKPTEKTTPGFSVILVFLAVFIGLFLIRRKNR